jgi:D-alanyl-lipoteichoic acid acyltransferase DltB (MBOAT superfamily)
MLWGFLKKMVVADNCATVVNDYYPQYSELPGITLFLLGILFTIQVYCDFSGYSDIAIGCARLFGFNLMRNFNIPFFSRSVPEFWRHWHISLTTWFRDYVFFPLGGSRCSQWKTVRNVYIVWGISGLWHGANWTFVCWGLIHATLLVIYTLLGINTKYKNTVAYDRYLPSIKETLQMVLTFLLFAMSMIVFRAENMGQAVDYLTAMVTNKFFDATMLQGKQPLCFALLLLSVEWLQRDKLHALQFTDIKPFKYRFVRWSVYYVILLVIFKYAGSSQTFVYFQF